MLGAPTGKRQFLGVKKSISGEWIRTTDHLVMSLNPKSVEFKQKKALKVPF